MTRSKLFASFAALAFSLSLAPAPAMAKNVCKAFALGSKKKSCRNEIKGCAKAQAFCYDKSVRGLVRAKCIRDKCRKPIIDACKKDPTQAVCGASPSGAFLNVARN
jgi:hypothetical protein